MLSAPAIHSACNRTLEMWFSCSKQQLRLHYVVLSTFVIKLLIGNASQLYADKLHLNTGWRPCEVTVFKDNDPTEGFCSQTHTQLCCFHPLGVHTNPPPPVPPFLLTLNQSPKDIAGSGITNCLTHVYML